jgi:putative ABC transport system permease protein
VAQPLRVLLAAVALLLMIACANVANLLLARAQSRQKEIAIRTAVGAGRFRLVRQLLTESLMLSLLGAVAGLVLGTWAIDILKRSLPADFPSFNPITLNARVLVFAAITAGITTLVFGLAPAIRLSRPDLNETLKEGGRGSSIGAGTRLRDGLAVAEIAISVLLLVGAGLLIRSFVNLTSVKPGFNPENVLSAYVALPSSKYGKDTLKTEFVRQVLERIRALPGVVSANFSAPAPFTNADIDINFTIEGRPAPPVGQEPVAAVQVVTPGYFQAMQIPLQRGREFSDRDIKGGIGSMVINETMAKRFWPDVEPVGQFVTGIGLVADRDSGEPDRYQIIGVVADVKYSQLDKATLPTMYFTENQKAFPWGYLSVRTTSDPLAFAPLVRAQVKAVDPDVPVSRVHTLDQMISTTVAQPRLFAILLSIFACVGLSLAAIGIYGVVSYSVAERSHEFGIRMALGADRQKLVQSVMGRAAVLAGCGVGIGIAGALGMGSLVQSLLFGVRPSDHATLVVTAGVLSIIMLVASYIPARRATTVDPIEVLRSQ